MRLIRTGLWVAAFAIWLAIGFVAMYGNAALMMLTAQGLK